MLLLLAEWYSPFGSALALHGLSTLPVVDSATGEPLQKIRDPNSQPIADFLRSAVAVQ